MAASKNKKILIIFWKSKFLTLFDWFRQYFNTQLTLWCFIQLFQLF
jgi:hypothetical protein